VTCERAQAALSARLDGERLPARVAGEVDEHVARCAACTAFVAGSERLRRAVRIRAAEDVPDLVEPIMTAVATLPRPRRLPRPGGRRATGARRPSWAPVAAALVVGLVAGSIAVGGPLRNPRDEPAEAARIVRGIRVAARRLSAYQARYTVVEHGMPGVDTRTFAMDVAFRAPERYRLDVRDLTTYPTGWGPTDLTFVQDGTATYRRGPLPCPAVIGPGACLLARGSTTIARSYEPEAPLAADLILPIDVLGSPGRVRVVATGSVLGRPAVEVATTFDRAQALFPFRTLGGTWRAIFPGDRVTIWLDADRWFALRASVYPVDDAERRAWEPRFGLGPEDPATPILDVAATSIRTSTPPPGTFAMPGGTAPDVAAASAVARRLGARPVTPTYTAGLERTSTVLPPAGGSSGGQALLTYTSGLSYLRVTEGEAPTGTTAVTALGPTTETIQLSNGTAYYLPASESRGRRLTIHTSDGDLLLETNLPREDLLRIAATLPIRAEAFPGR